MKHTPTLPAGHAAEPVVVSGSWLLRDAHDGEDATSMGARWTVGFEAWFVGHSDSCPQWAVSSTVAEMVARWSAEYQHDQFGKTRRWAASDGEAREIVDAETRYDFDGHQLTARRRSRKTGTWFTTAGLQLMTTVGQLHHLVGDWTWTETDPALVDLVHRTREARP